MVVQNAGIAALNPTDPLVPWNFTMRDPDDDEVVVKVLYCGICHSDIHTVRGDWKNAHYPVVPGHEIVGVVEKLGTKVDRLKIGQNVAVGCFVDCCKSASCEPCASGEEQFCPDVVFTYSQAWKGAFSYGGYARYVLSNERLVFPVPEGIPLAKVAPLLCAGITMYNPIFSNNMDRGNLKIAVVGLGGLGHMAVQIAKKCGPNNEITVISRSKAKEQIAIELGASQVIQMSNPEHVAKYQRYFDYILYTVPAVHELAEAMLLLKPRGSMITVAAPPKDENFLVPPHQLLVTATSLQGSLVGGVKHTQAMLEFCAKNQVLPWIEEIKANQVNEAYDRVLKSNIKFRFVINVHESDF